MSCNFIVLVLWMAIKVFLLCISPWITPDHQRMIKERMSSSHCGPSGTWDRPNQSIKLFELHNTINIISLQFFVANLSCNLRIKWTLPSAIFCHTSNPVLSSMTNERLNVKDKSFKDIWDWLREGVKQKCLKKLEKDLFATIGFYNLT